MKHEIIITCARQPCAKVETYVMRTTWQRALHSIRNPTHKPVSLVNNLLPDWHLKFTPLDRLQDPLAVRNWLHEHAIRHNLFGWYEHRCGHYETKVLFQGLYFAFRQLSDAIQFQLYFDLDQMPPRHDTSVPQHLAVMVT